MDAIFLLEEVTVKNNSAVAAYGEILSSNIIYEILRYNGVKSKLKDARELIQTETHFEREIVNESVTVKQIKNYFDKNETDVTIIPGFIAKNKNGSNYNSW